MSIKMNMKKVFLNFGRVLMAPDSRTQHASSLLNFRFFALSALKGTKPFFVFTRQKNKNFPKLEVKEFKKSKFFIRQGKSGVNPLWIYEHFDDVLCEICLYKPYWVRLFSALWEMILCRKF